MYLYSYEYEYIVQVGMLQRIKYMYLVPGFTSRSPQSILWISTTQVCALA